MKIGILRETKSPPDKRVPLIPAQCLELMKRYPQVEIVVQPDTYRCYSNDEFRTQEIDLQEDLSDCDVLMGVKEVKTEYLIAHKTYLFFSHTAKEQPYNRELLLEIVNKGIRLIDYEYLTRYDNTRIIAFGRWAGIVGAYNGLRAYGLRSGKFDLKPAHQSVDLREILNELKGVDLDSAKIVITGGGRVAGGAEEILKAVGLGYADPEKYLNTESADPTYTRLEPWHYTRKKDGRQFDFNHFVAQPGEYENNFLPYAMKSDIYIACHFWDPESPVLLTSEHLKNPGFPVRVIADISCDINGPIASTIRASTIADPFYGYDPVSGEETGSFEKDAITVMAVDNLPGELPRDASGDFGSVLAEHIIPLFLGDDSENVLERATISRDGKLTKRYSYLENYLKGY